MEQRQHRRSNRLQSLAIITAMAILLALSGYVIGGGLGFTIACGVALFLILSSSRASPNLILKMYKAVPISQDQAPQLVSAFHAVVERSGLDHMPSLYYVPTQMLNAFAVGRGQQTAVAVTHGLLQNMNLREVTGVLAHEVSHILHQDLWVMGLADVFSRLTTAMGQVGQLMLIFSLPMILMGVEMPWIAVIVLLLAPLASGLLQLALSRSREFEADFGAAQITNDPAGLASALHKIDRVQGGWWERLLLPGRKVPDPALLRSHPPTKDRIEKLLSMSDTPSIQTPTQETRLVLEKLPSSVPLRRPRWHVMSGLWY